VFVLGTRSVLLSGGSRVNVRPRVKHPIHFHVNWAILGCDVIPDGTN